MPIIMSLPNEKHLEHRQISKHETRTIIRDTTKEMVAKAIIRLTKGKLFSICFKRRHPKPGYPDFRVMNARTGVSKYVKGTEKYNRKAVNAEKGILTVFEMGGIPEERDKVEWRGHGLVGTVVLSSSKSNTCLVKFRPEDNPSANPCDLVMSIEIPWNDVTRIAYRNIPLSSIMWIKCGGERVDFVDGEPFISIGLQIRR